VNTLLDLNLQNEQEMDSWLSAERAAYAAPSNSEEVALSRVGPRLYEKLFKHYTFKQWAKYPSQLEPSVLERIPVRTSFDARYFTDRFQALPTNGYTSIVESMLDHPNIVVKLDCAWTPDMPRDWNQLVFTGPIDMYFKGNDLAALEYRSIEFKKEYHVTSGFYQANSVVNYSDAANEYTRCVEYKHFLNQKSPWTIMVKEKTTDKGEPYYPVPTETNRALYQKYKALADNAEGVHFVGRLASYKYFNMDQAIRNAMDYYRTKLLII
jgi:UDP-galactopyranose mutase